MKKKKSLMTAGVEKNGTFRSESGYVSLRTLSHDGVVKKAEAAAKSERRAAIIPILGSWEKNSVWRIQFWFA